MGATNTTANYSLSQFIGTDKPAWLQDYNGDMLKIDTGINAAKVAADGAQNAASAAQNDANTANSAITNTINPAISSLTTTVGNQGGSINTINSLIGNGTPTTTDQTIIGAINEINSKVTPNTLGSVMGDGVQTFAQLLNGLYTALASIVATLTDEEKMSLKIIINHTNGSVINVPIIRWSSSELLFAYVTTGSVSAYRLASSSTYTGYTFSSGPTDDSSTVVPSGFKISVIRD